MASGHAGCQNWRQDLWGRSVSLDPSASLLGPPDHPSLEYMGPPPPDSEVPLLITPFWSAGLTSTPSAYCQRHCRLAAAAYLCPAEVQLPQRQLRCQRNTAHNCNQCLLSLKTEAGVLTEHYGHSIRVDLGAVHCPPLVSRL